MKVSMQTFHTEYYLTGERKMKTLCIFTNEFPYGTWEPYLETEINYYKDFEKVYIFSLQLRKEHSETKRKLPDNFKVIPIFYAPKWVYLVNSIFVLTDKNLYRELRELKKEKRLQLPRIIDLFVYLSRSHYEMKKIKKAVNIANMENPIFYSYRFEYQPYVALLLKKHLGKNIPVIARAHRFDLYENARRHDYLPLRRILLENLTAVCPCSQDGSDYLTNNYPEFSEKIHPEFLGTVDHGVCAYNKDKIFSIVSCSTVISVKRLHLIVRALEKIKDYDIKWTHFGDGVLMDDIKNMTKKLPNNISTDFRGNIANEELLKFYSNEQFEILLNVSESEGIPVSIMEAMSFGIPCIATDVGGTKEIVTDKYNGILLEKNFEPEILAQWICKFIEMPSDEYMQYRKNARISWENKYNAEKNYEMFMKKLLRMGEQYEV